MSSPSSLTFTPSASDPFRFRIDLKFDDQYGEAANFVAWLAKTEGRPGISQLNGYLMHRRRGVSSMVFIRVRDVEDLTGLDPHLDHFLFGVSKTIRH